MGGRFDEDWYRDHQAKVQAQRAPTHTRLVDRDAEAARQLPLPQTKRKRPEEDLQKLQVKYLEWALMAPWRFLHIPNQKGTRSTWENRLLKALGVQEGAADILFLGPNARFVWIENKSDIGRLSEAQEGWRDWCLATGAQWYLCRSLNDMIEACVDAGIPLRARPA